MILEVYTDIYKVELALPNNPLKAINIYIIKGKDKSLIIDTDFNLERCKNDLLSALDNLNIGISNAELFITHLHSDHCGLASYFEKEGCKIYG